MSLGDAKVNSSVLQLGVVAVTETVGVHVLTLVMSHRNAANSYLTATIAKNDVATGVQYRPFNKDLFSDVSYNDDLQQTQPRSTMFGHFVLFSGCITIAMLAVMSLLQFRQNRTRARRRQRYDRNRRERRQREVGDVSPIFCKHMSLMF
jgi:hypothetical protein